MDLNKLATKRMPYYFFVTTIFHLKIAILNWYYTYREIKFMQSHK